MSERRRIIPVIALIICVGTILYGLGVALVHQGKAARIARSTTRIADYRAAIMAYSNTFGVLPVGNNATTTALLTASNEMHMVFISFDKEPSRTLNQRGEYLDPSGVPYDIEVTTNTIHITSRSE